MDIMRATEGASLVDENGKETGDEKLMAQIGKKEL